MTVVAPDERPGNLSRDLPVQFVLDEKLGLLKRLEQGSPFILAARLHVSLVMF